ncbi:MAG: efflux RND transporter periplasmic adaptor subunit [Arenicellales bacterium]
MKTAVKIFLPIVPAVFLWSSAFAEEALVSVDPVIKQDFTQTVPILGKLVAKQSGIVASRTAGAVEEILVQVGDQVTQGQLIAVIDAESHRLEKRLAEVQRTEAETRITTARAQLALASQEVKRLSTLESSAAVSKAALDDANQQQRIAFAKVREAEAAVNSSDASIRLVDLELRYANVTAPFEGTVTAKLTEVGSYLQRGQPVVQLVSDQRLELEADIPGNRLAGLTPGRQIDISLDDGSQYKAILRAIVPEENPKTRTRRVRFDLDLNPRILALAVQQSVTLHVPAGASREITSVHKDAIIRRGPDSVVYVVQDGVAKLRPVQTGEALGTRLEVLQGLNEGDKVVIRGNERLIPDQTVVVAGE